MSTETQSTETKDTESLKESITEVRKYMQEALDAHERDLLGDLVNAIGQLGSGGGDQTSESIGEELDQRAVDFDSRHPKLSKLLREIMDTLGKMGV